MNIKNLFSKILSQNLDKKVQYWSSATWHTNMAINSTEKGVCDCEYIKGKNVIVSLTTFGDRIHDAHLSIESIMQGSMKPNKIVLWIDEQNSSCQLPMVIRNQCQRGLEVRYVKDIRSYTKLIPALREYPEDVIITIDDDIIYNYDLIENLISSYLSDPSCIHACRIKKVCTEKNALLNYSDWTFKVKNGETSYRNCQTGVGGVLYPPHCFDFDVFDEDVFLDICKYADDIWFYCMAVKAGTKIKKAFNRNYGGEDYLYPIEQNGPSLRLINVSKGISQNDLQFQNVCKKYNILKTILDS